MSNPKEIEVERINEFNESANDLNIKKIILSIAESIRNGKNLKVETTDSNIIGKYIAYCGELSPNRYLNIEINVNERRANIKNELSTIYLLLSTELSTIYYSINKTSIRKKNHRKTVYTYRHSSFQIFTIRRPTNINKRLRNQR